MKTYLFPIAILVLILPSILFAHGNYTETTQIIETDGIGLMALASSGHNFDWTSISLQGSISGAFDEGGNQAISFAIGKRIGRILINGNIATTINESGYVGVVSGTWHF